MNPSGVGTTLAVRRMFSHISGGTTVFTTQRQTLQQTQGNQDDGSGHADTGIGRQHAHDEGGQAHDQDGHQEGVFATNHVAQAAKENRTKRTHDEACCKRQQREDERRALVQSAEKLLGNDGGQ